jgi:hypothetical protein
MGNGWRQDRRVEKTGMNGRDVEVKFSQVEWWRAREGGSRVMEV